MSTALSTTGGGGDNGHKGQGNHGKGASKKVSKPATTHILLMLTHGRNATGVAAVCAVCAATAPTTTGDMLKAAPMPGKEPQSSTSL